MIKRIVYVLVLLVMVLAGTVVAQTGKVPWQPLKGYWPGGPLTMDTEHFDYDKASDTATMWVKWTFHDGSVNRNHCLINFPKATLRVIYSGWFRPDGSLQKEFKGEHDPAPVCPDSWQQQACDIIAKKVGRQPVYGETLRWKPIGIDAATQDRIFLGENTTTYNPEISSSYVWILVKKPAGNAYTAAYKCQFLTPYTIGKADATIYPEMAPPDNELERIVIKGAHDQYKEHVK